MQRTSRVPSGGHASRFIKTFSWLTKLRIVLAAATERASRLEACGRRNMDHRFFFGLGYRSFAMKIRARLLFLALISLSRCLWTSPTMRGRSAWCNSTPEALAATCDIVRCKQLIRVHGWTTPGSGEALVPKRDGLDECSSSRLKKPISIGYGGSWIRRTKATDDFLRPSADPGLYVSLERPWKNVLHLRPVSI